MSASTFRFSTLLTLAGLAVLSSCADDPQGLGERASGGGSSGGNAGASPGGGGSMNGSGGASAGATNLPKGGAANAGSAGMTAGGVASGGVAAGGKAGGVATGGVVGQGGVVGRGGSGAGGNTVAGGSTARGGTAGSGGQAGANSGGGAGGADAGCAALSCTSTQVCVAYRVLGGTLQLPDASGKCPAKYHVEPNGTTGQCVSDFAYECREPVGCGTATLSCSCGAATCPSTYNFCQNPNASAWLDPTADLVCELLAP